MKFVCERCQTRYSIADEKVRQKILKIRCKTCENVITVRDPSASAAAPVTSATAIPVSAPAAPPPPPSRADATARVWFVAVNGEQGGPLARADAVRRIADAKATDEIYVWKEDFDSWKEPKDVPALMSEVRALRMRTSSPPAPPPLRAAPPPLAKPVSTSGPVATAKAPAAAASGARPSKSVSLPAPTSASGAASKSAVSLPAPASASLPAPTSGARASASLATFGETEHTEIAPMDLFMGANADGTAEPAGAAASVPAASLGPAAPASPSPLASIFDGTSSFSLPNARPVLGTSPGGAVPGAPMPRAESGLSRLTGLPGFVSRNPAVKFITAGAVVVALLVAVVAVMVMRPGQPDASAPTPAKTNTAAVAADDPEQRARQEAEQRFKASVGSTESVATVRGDRPEPRRGKAAEPKQRPTTTPAIAPPPVNPVDPAPIAPPPPTSGRLAGGERRVAPLVSDQARQTAAAAAAGPSEGMITAVVKRKENQDALRSCYERALKRDDRLRSGRIDVTASVGRSGTVKTVHLSAPPEFSTMESCIRSAVRRWHFPANADEYAINFPLILQGNL